MASINQESADYDHYVTQNFHNLHTIDNLMSICKKQLPHLVSLTAPEDFGKHFLIEAVMHRLKTEFYKVRTILIDAALVNDAKIDNVYTGWLRISDPEQAGKQAASLFVDEMQPGTDLLVIYVKNALELDSMRSGRLLAAVTGNPKALLVLSDIELIYPGNRRIPIPHTVIKLPLYKKRSLKAILKSKFKKNNFNNAFYALLDSYSCGYPEFLAEGIALLVKHRFLEQRENARWVFDSESFLAGGGQECLARNLKTQIGRILSGYDKNVGEAIKTFFRICALCGSIIPLQQVYDAITDDRDLQCRIGTAVFKHFFEGCPLPLFTFRNHPADRIIRVQIGNNYLVLANLKFISSVQSRIIAHDFLPGNPGTAANTLLDFLMGKRLMENRDWIRMLHRLYIYANKNPLFSDLPRLPGWINLHNPVMLKELIFDALQQTTLSFNRCLQYIGTYHRSWPPAVIRGLLDALAAFSPEVKEDMYLAYISACTCIKLGDTATGNSLFAGIIERVLDFFGTAGVKALDDLCLVEPALYALAGSWPFDKTAECLARVCAIKREWMPDYREIPGCTARNLAVLFLKAGEKEQARVLITPLLNSAIADHEPDHDKKAESYTRLIRLAEQVGDNANAALLKSRLQEYRQSIVRKEMETNQQELKASQETKGIADLVTLGIRNSLALNYLAMGDYAAALELQNETIEILKTSLPGEKTALLAAEETLAGILSAAGKPGEAYTIQQAVAGGWEEHSRENPSNALLAKQRLAMLLLKLGEPGQALSVYKDAAENFRPYTNPYAQERFSALKLLARIYRALGNEQQADLIMEAELRTFVFACEPHKTYQPDNPLNVELVDYYYDYDED